MKSQLIYTDADVAELYYAGRELARILRNCHLSAEHRERADYADSALNRAMVRICDRADRRKARLAREEKKNGRPKPPVKSKKF